MATTWLTVQKELIIDKIKETIDFIIELPMKHMNNKDYENIVFILDEARINCENNKYFDIEDIDRNFSNLDPLLNGYGLNDIDNMVSLYNKNIIESFINVNFYLFQNNEDLDEFTKRISCHKDLREKLINLILENYSLKDLDLIADNDDEIKKFIEKVLS